MTPDEHLHLAEVTLREFIASTLRAQHGSAWIQHTGKSAETIAKWEHRREVERKRRAGAVVDERLLSYADFYDLLDMIRKNWEAFKPCFGDQTRLRIYLERLGGLRDPGAHSRTLLPFERALIEGMTGELRQQVSIFQAQGDGSSEPEHFPHIVEVVDSFGNRIEGNQDFPPTMKNTQITVRPGNEVTFTGSAWDPDGRDLIWHIGGLVTRTIHFRGNDFEWGWRVAVKDIGQLVPVYFAVESDRPYHRSGKDDDVVALTYKVLPNAPQRDAQPHLQQ